MGKEGNLLGEYIPNKRHIKTNLHIPEKRVGLEEFVGVNSLTILSLPFTDNTEKEQEAGEIN